MQKEFESEVRMKTDPKTGEYVSKLVKHIRFIPSEIPSEPAREVAEEIEFRMSEDYLRLVGKGITTEVALGELVDGYIVEGVNNIARSILAGPFAVNRSKSAQRTWIVLKHRPPEGEEGTLFLAIPRHSGDFYSKLFRARTGIVLESRPWNEDR